MAGYWKTAVAVIGAVLVVLQSALDPVGAGGAGVTLDEGVVIGNALMNAILVYVVPDLDRGVAKYAKPVVAGALAVLSVLVSVLADGLSASDVVNLVIVFGTGAGVLAAKAPKHRQVARARTSQH